MDNLNTVVELSRLQFAATALYHFLFVPLTLGLSFILAAMETVYVTTGKTIYRDMTMFWGKLFAINFALGVATGLTMEFEFGTNWSQYSRFVGDIFGAPLAIEGLVAFFMESTFVGLMLFGWHRLSRGQHLIVTYLVALGSNMSALWILVANGFMQDPVGAAFNPVTMRMELTDFAHLIFSADAQAKFVHTSIAGFVTGAIFVTGVSAWYMLRNRHLEIARRSFRMAALFGVFSCVGVIGLGDALGLIDSTAQPAKLVAMEGLWKTEQPPVGFNLFAIPDQEAQENNLEVKIPAVLSLLVTHSLDKPIPGADQVQQDAIARMQNGIPAALALKRLSANPDDSNAMAQFRAHEKDLGYAFLVQRYAPDLAKVTAADFEKAARDVIPNVPVTFWSFRIMIAAGFAMLLFLIFATIYSIKNTAYNNRALLKAAVWLIPVPYIACELGWVVAEVGRQPWTVYEMLPTWMSASTHSVGYMAFSLIGFVLIYSSFAIVEVYLMVKFIRKGPDPLTPDPLHPVYHDAVPANAGSAH